MQIRDTSAAAVRPATAPVAAQQSPFDSLKAREPGVRYLASNVRDVVKILRPGQLVVFESTTYPGMTRDDVSPIVAISRLRQCREKIVKA